MAEPQRPLLTTTSDQCTVIDEQGRSTSFPKYRCKALPEGRTIRLLKYEAQTQPWPLSQLSRTNEFSLEEHVLDNTDVTMLDVSNSPYVAMSYSWGTGSSDSPLVITAQGQRMILPVTATAWEAVQRTLPAIGAYGKSMWIDQICIDQGNSEEKKQQVRLMGDIYRRCWHCMIWLGHADVNTASAFVLLRRLQQTFKHDQPMPMDERQVADLSHAQIRTELASTMGKDVLPPPNDPGWVEMARLLTRDWFNRLWTFQEAVLCYKGDATIRCVHYYIPFTTFARASMVMGNEHIFRGINFTNGRAGLTQTSSFRFKVENRNLTPMILLLQNNVTRGCTNPRDRIYGLLGLRNEDGPEFPIDVDYGKTPKALYTEVARSIIRSQRSLRLCAEAPEREPGGGIPDLPSWVPDWTKTPLTSIFELLNYSGSYFKASNGRLHHDSTDDPNLLKAEGKAVDKIVDIVETEIPAAVTQAERRKALVEDVLPLLQATLQSMAPAQNLARISHTIINTITVGGYTRTHNLGDSGLPPAAWSRSVCDDMLPIILNMDSRPINQPPEIDPERWLHALTREALQCTDRRFALLQHNLLVLVPKMSEVGDLIVILHGSSLPFVLRDVGNGCFRLIGVCFVDGIMHAERESTGSQVIRSEFVDYLGLIPILLSSREQLSLDSRLLMTAKISRPFAGFSLPSYH